MKNKKTWVIEKAKGDIFIKSIFAVVFIIYIIYRLGYAIGKFLAFIGF